RDISERTYAEEQIKHLAYHDALTGLPNRLLFKDRLTVALSHAQRNGSRESDTVARLGGDEFTLLLPNLNRSDDAVPVAQKLLEAVRYPFHIEGREFF